MSGRPTPIDAVQQARRHFLKQLLSLAAMPIAAGVAGCRGIGKYSHITGKIVGANSKTGHLLRGAASFATPTQKKEVDILIVGGGISGLSANRWLKQKGLTNVLLLEMDEQAGGNSVSGANSASAYPWGAHYLPIPDVANQELLGFLHSTNTITGYSQAGLPIYNEYHLCHDPQERLFINGMWQEGLVPRIGITTEDRQQIARFFAEVETYKNKKGADGKYQFQIPIDQSSNEDSFRELDKISFDRYLTTNNYTSPYLRWYLEYGCKDDYGATLSDTSAWAGLHYFVARRGVAANASPSSVLTWPEGNAFLMRHLKEQGVGEIYTRKLVYKVQTTDSGIDVFCYDTSLHTTLQICSKRVILATPQYVNRKLLPAATYRESIYPMLSYAPWLVANITLNQFPHTVGYPLCWDNVIFGQQSVGYIYANQQNLNHVGKSVITYYLPFTGDPAKMRTRVHQSTYSQWQEMIIKELEFAHNGITQHITQLDIWVWGHGMIRPTPGYIWGKERELARQPIADKIFFAHTDLSGISIFEEGFYQGIHAAEQLLATL
jgi:hypothetical protein